MNLWRISSLALPLALAACSDTPAPEVRGLQLQVAPLELTSIDVACYDVLVTGAEGDVWSLGDPYLGADQGDTPVCSDQYGNGAGGDISYVGPCDASAGADTDPTQDGVQNSVTIWFDGLYTGSSEDGLESIDAGLTETIQGICQMQPPPGWFQDWIPRCAYPDYTGSALLPHPTCNSETLCVAEVPVSTWQDPCGDAGCTLSFDCNENEDTLVQFNFTVMRDAKQGFFDIAVNFEDVFCSAKYDTCYDVGAVDERPIELLFGADGERNHTGVMGLACAGSPNTSDATTLRRSEIWVWCDDWDHYFAVDPTLGAGNVEIDEEDYVAPSPGEIGNCIDACSTIREVTAYLACVEACQGDPKTLRYATYWGTEQLDCGNGPGSCNKVYWNVAFDLEHLQDQGLQNCQMVSIATATSADSTVFSDGEILQSGTTYPIIDFGNMNGSWNTGLPLTGAGAIPCVAEAVNAPDSLVQTDYASSGNLSQDDIAQGYGPIVNSYDTWLCMQLTGGDARPSYDPECLANYCDYSGSGAWCDVP